LACYFILHLFDDPDKLKQMPTKSRILIADDDLESLSRLYLSLLHKQMKTEAINSIEEVSSRITQFKPHILIISTSLIKEEVNAFCKRIRSGSRLIPILMKEKTVENNFLFDVIEKPIDIGQLMEIINLYRF
jgi:DNA-binding response OmpR family regulator